MHEIITLQFGPVANYAGTHFWNIQDALRSQIAVGSDSPTDTGGDKRPSMSMLFREGVNYRRETTYTPRVLIFDRNDNFGALKRENALFADVADVNSEAVGTWHGHVETHRQPEYYKNQYTRALDEEEKMYLQATSPRASSRDDLSHDLVQQRYHDPMANLKPLQESDVRTWSDYNGVYYHPRSFHPISGIKHGDSLGELRCFLEGANEFDMNEKTEDIVEGDFRMLCEESDSIQGFQVMADAYGGFAGYASHFIEACHDEYPKTSVLLYTMSAKSRADLTGSLRKEAAVNIAASIEHVSLVLPLFAPNKDHVRTSIASHSELAPKNGALYNLGAIYSLLVDTVVQPLLSSRTDMSDLVYAMSRPRMSLVSASISARSTLGGGGSGASEDWWRAVADTNGSAYLPFLDTRLQSTKEEQSGAMFHRQTILRGCSKETRGVTRLPSAVMLFDSAVRLPFTFPELFIRQQPHAPSVPEKNHGQPEGRDLNGPHYCRYKPESANVAVHLRNSALIAKDYIGGLYSSLRIPGDKHFKDYEAEIVKQYEESLRSTIDLYSSDSVDA